MGHIAAWSTGTENIFFCWCCVGSGLLAGVGVSLSTLDLMGHALVGVHTSILFPELLFLFWGGQKGYPFAVLYHRRQLGHRLGGKWLDP